MREFYEVYFAKLNFASGAWMKDVKVGIFSEIGMAEKKAAEIHSKKDITVGTIFVKKVSFDEATGAFEEEKVLKI